MAISAGAAIASTAAGVVAGGAASLTFATTLAGFGIGAIASHFLVTTALGAALNALSPKPKTSSGLQRGYQTSGKGSALDHAIVYGRMRVGGAVVFETATGTNNKYLHQVIAVAGHEVEEFESFTIDGNEVTLDENGFATEPSQYNQKVRIKTHVGTSDQAADSDLVAEVTEWTNQHRLRGVAYIYVRYAFDADAFPNGIPSITTIVKGKKLFDPRSGATEWSSNPALAIRDYLTNPTYGLGEPDENIDDDLVILAADRCDATNTKNGTKWFTCNGSFVTSGTPYELLTALLGSMGGLLWYGQGKWRMRAAQWVAPQEVYTLDDLRGPITVKTRHSRRDNYNTVKGTFLGEESDWQETDYPPITNQAFLNADGGQESVADINYPFTSNVAEARRLARISLERNRQQLTVDITTSLKGVRNQVGDNIQLTLPRYGWQNKPFEVVAWTLSVEENLGVVVVMSLRETSASIFDEKTDGGVYERDNTTLLDPFEVPSLGITVEPFAQVLDEKVVNTCNIFTSTSRPEAVDQVEVQIQQLTKLNKATGVEVPITRERTNLGTGELGYFGTTDLDRGTWEIRARAINTFGIKGAWTTVQELLDSNDEPPAVVTGFKRQIAGTTLFLSWNPLDEPDLSYYQIKYNSNMTGATWGNSQVLVERIARPATSATVLALPGTYLIKAWDKSGQTSELWSEITIQEAEVPVFGTPVNLPQHPTFDGLKVDTEVNNTFSPVRLVSTDLNNPTGYRGFYYMDNGGLDYVDAGSVTSIFISSKARVFRYGENVDLWDSIPGKWDNFPGLFDSWTGSSAAFDDYRYVLQVSTTNDDPSGSPVWSAWEDYAAGVVVARAVRMRVALFADTDGISPSFEELTFKLEY
jgi:hypothetical protein